MSTLGLDEDELVACVACGLCLPHCPTYRVTGMEIASPRGRIAAMRAVEAGAPTDDTFLRAMDECVQCRGCEVACPSGVQFGHMMEQTRTTLHESGRSRARRRATGRRVGRVLRRAAVPRGAARADVGPLARAVLAVGAAPGRRTAPPARSLGRVVDAPRAAQDQPDAFVFTGCVMDAWMRDTHRATVRVMRAAGARVARPQRGGDCCGALHLHAGRRQQARRLARRVISSMPGDAVVVVNSAGCGAAMKAYGELLDTDEARAFSARVRDFSEWLVEAGVPGVRHSNRVVVVQDPCHLRHVQRTHQAVRTVLGAAYSLAETDDDGLCCGAGGAYSVLQPALSMAIRDRKVAALRRAATGRDRGVGESRDV